MRRIELAYLSVVATGSLGVVAGLAAWDVPLFPSAPAGGASRASLASFVNWESPHVHPIEMTPDGSRLLVVNTADNRLDVYSLLAPGGRPALVGSVPVGLDPVAVRVRTGTEAWVVNHVSDSVSIVNLTTMNVVRTLRTQDEPCDVVFAGTGGVGGGARAFVSCSQANSLQVFDPAAPAVPPVTIAIDAEDPRSMAVSPDGSKVYVGIFESGNGTTVLGGSATGNGTIVFPPDVVSDPLGPWAGDNPPPNAGAGFQPPIGPGAASPIPVSLIVKHDDQGRWMDDNGGNWTNLVSGPQANRSGRPPGWNLPDRDVAVIDAGTLSVQYASGVMNICMALSVNPATGRVAVVGTDATNQIRYEPNLRGRFVRVNVGLVDPALMSPSTIKDLNAHLDYSVGQLPTQADRDRALGDPRGIVWNAAGTRAYVSGMGSNNVVVINGAGDRAGINDTIEVREGPTGLALDEPRARLYVLNRFDGSISIIDTATELEADRVAFFDPTPQAIKTGRKHLFDTHKNSGLGQASCASCHVDTRMDRLAWDLGDPAGEPISELGQNLGMGLPGLEPNTTSPPYEPFHPMKGPMTTQTLQDIIGKEPHHWRGDRTGIEQFADAFMLLQGDDATLTDTEMQEFEDYLATITFPPNPFRNFNNTLPTSLPLPGHFTTGRFGPPGLPLPNGNAAAGLALYRSGSRRLDGGAFACVTCHTLPTGLGTDTTRVGPSFVAIPPGPDGERHHALVSVDGTTNISTKIPQLRNMYEKTGFNTTQTSNRAGFGLLHDGSVDSIERFISEPVFTVQGNQEVANLVAFMLAFSGSDLPLGSVNNPLDPPGTSSQDTHAAVGFQVTAADGQQAALINTLLTLVDNPLPPPARPNRVAVVVKGIRNGLQRGYLYNGAGVFQSDRQGEQVSQAVLFGSAAPGSELTYTVVPFNARLRLALDRDEDGWYDRDEVDACADPADPLRFPGSQGSIDVNGDLVVNVQDFLAFLNLFSVGDIRADFNADGVTNVQDFLAFLNAYAGGC